jgi:hypothetical protein
MAAQCQELYPESASRTARAEEGCREAGALVATAGDQDFGWSQVGDNSSPASGGPLWLRHAGPAAQLTPRDVRPLTGLTSKLHGVGICRSVGSPILRSSDVCRTPEVKNKYGAHHKPPAGTLSLQAWMPHLRRDHGVELRMRRG